MENFLVARHNAYERCLGVFHSRNATKDTTGGLPRQHFKSTNQASDYARRREESARDGEKVED
jgi:hypothetical protein